MRVAHIDTGRDWRGGQAQVLLLLRGLSERGHAVVLAAPEAPLAERACAASIEWLPVRTGGDLDFGAGRRLAKGLAAWRPDLLHAHTARAHTLARSAGPRLGVPIVVSRRVLAPIGRNPFSRRKYLEGVARYLCISRAVMDVLVRGGIDAARVALVPSAVDAQGLSELRQRLPRDEAAVRLRDLLGAGPDAEVFGAVGALTREKGTLTFANAAAEVCAARPAAFGVWIGDGPERAGLERTLARRGLASRVRVLGFRHDVHALLAQCSLLVSTSVREGLSNVVLEAQALGVPVVTTDSGGVRDSIDSGVNGWIVEDTGLLSGAIVAALGNPATLARWRDAALVSVLRFSPERTLDATLAEYARIMTETAVPAAD